MSKTKLKGVLLSRIDSDDMFSENYIELVQQKQFKTKRALVLKKGYVLFLQAPSILKRIKWRIGRTIKQ